MKHPLAIFIGLILATLQTPAHAQTPSAPPANDPPPQESSSDKSNAEQAKKATEWVASLGLNDPAKESRVKEVIVAHLKAIRDWHNDHPATTVPAGINPTTGKTLSELDREVIADSAMPKSVHEKFMGGLRKELTGDQVEAVLDKITVGKVAFTLTGYRAIVPNMTREEETYIVTSLEQAREEAVDFKNMNEISAIFKIHKTQIEQYLNANGRNWKVIYKTYVDSVKAKKAGTNSLTTEPTQ